MITFTNPFCIETRPNIIYIAALGNAGDALDYHSGARFTTEDVDNDHWLTGNCAYGLNGPWWYRGCGFTSLNNHYYHRGEHTSKNDGITWFEWKDSFYSVKKASMKIRGM